MNRKKYFLGYYENLVIPFCSKAMPVFYLAQTLSICLLQSLWILAITTCGILRLFVIIHIFMCLNLLNWFYDKLYLSFSQHFPKDSTIFDLNKLLQIPKCHGHSSDTLCLYSLSFSSHTHKSSPHFCFSHLYLTCY